MKMMSICMRRSSSLMNFCRQLTPINVKCVSTTSRLRVEDTFQSKEPLPSTPERRPLPLMTSRTLNKVPYGMTAKQTWLESLDTIPDEKLGLIDLHPQIFGVFPRIDILYRNIHWQKMYKYVDYSFVPNRAELKGSNKKIRPQKGTGRARQGHIRAPHHKGGGKAYGPRGPTSYFYMLPKNERILGLRTALSCKFAQNNLHIVENLDIPDDDPEYIETLIEARGWGLSVLFIHDTDVIPSNLAIALDQIPQYNAMPLYGLNVYSMLKHETLILSLKSLELLEEKLVAGIHSPDWKDRAFSKYGQGL